MKTFLILFFLGYDGTLTFYQAEAFGSREQCEQLNAHINFDAYGDFEEKARYFEIIAEVEA